MTDPYVAPDWQHWQHLVTEPFAPQVADPIAWRTEAIVAVLVATYSVILGGVAGFLWPKLAPHVHLMAAVNGSEAASKALLGDDLWLALLGIIAGVVAVAILTLAARDAGSGPGATIGLAVGGVLGTLVAAQVGHLVQQPHVAHSLRAAFPGITHSEVTTILGYFGFRLRLKAVVVAWPVTAVLLHGIIVGLRWQRAVSHPALVASQLP